MAPSRSALLAHRLAVRMARPLIRAPARPTSGRPRVTILMMDAYALSGAARTVLTVAGHLARTHDVEILSVLQRRAEPAFEFPPGVRVTPVDGPRPQPRALRLVHRVLAHGRGRLIHPAIKRSSSTSLWTDLKLVRALRRVRSGLVIGTGPPLDILVAQLARPGVATVGEDHLFYAFRDPSLQAELRRWAPRLGAFVVLTERDRRDYAAALGPDARVVRIPNAVRPLSGPAADLSSPVILGAGRLGWQKGFERLIRAFGQIADEAPEWRLRIAGRGPAEERLEARIAELGLQGRVELLGAVDDMGAEFARASIFALTSRWEGLPLVVIEAMSKGLPVVSFDCPTGPAEVVEDGRTGYLVPEGDVTALAGRLRQLVADEEQRRRLGAEAARRAEEFRMDRIGPMWDALVAELLAAAGAAPRAVGNGRGRGRYAAAGVKP